MIIYSYPSQEQIAEFAGANASAPQGTTNIYDLKFIFKINGENASQETIKQAQLDHFLSQRINDTKIKLGQKVQEVEQAIQDSQMFEGQTITKIDISGFETVANYNDEIALITFAELRSFLQKQNLIIEKKVELKEPIISIIITCNLLE